jgi:hypothetical protein
MRWAIDVCLSYSRSPCGGNGFASLRPRVDICRDYSHGRPMDTMKLLLGATVALLLGALAVSWQGMNTGVKNATPDEIARLKSQVAELRKEQDKLALEKQLQQLKANTPTLAPTPTPAANAAEIEAMKVQLEAGKQRLAAIEAEKGREGRQTRPR